MLSHILLYTSKDIPSGPGDLVIEEWQIALVTLSRVGGKHAAGIDSKNSSTASGDVGTEEYKDE